MFYKEHFPYVKISRGESAHLLESANSGVAVSHIPLTPLHFFSSSLSVTCPDLTDRMKTGNNFSRAEAASLALCESMQELIQPEYCICFSADRKINVSQV